MTHTQTSTDCGPDFCDECSSAAQEWVRWPCSGSLLDPCPECYPWRPDARVRYRCQMHAKGS